VMLCRGAAGIKEFRFVAKNLGLLSG
jgi:hypothetical protein